MSDKEKELDKQDKPADTDIKIKFEPSGEKVGPFVVKKTPESIKIENAQTPPADSLDINSNLGSFGSNENLTNEPTDIKPVISTEKISALEKIQEKSDQLSNTDTHAKIDFQKFERKKDVKIKNAFLLKFDNWLRQPKTLLRIWLIAIASIVVI
jgi:hypothetical protein